jgi:hypothetical protein
MVQTNYFYLCTFNKTENHVKEQLHPFRLGN